MSLENDITQVYVSNNGTSVQSTASTTSTQSSSNTSPNTVFDKKAEELAKKLGITQEEYLQIAQDPKFSTLSIFYHQSSQLSIKKGKNKNR